jgi:SAM-dependent methyltransferase
MKDKTGFEVLQVINKASRFNQWLFKTIEPFCNGRILEIGSGIGNISEFFVRQNYDVTFSDIDLEYVILLKKQFVNDKNVREILNIDLQLPDFLKQYRSLKEKYDTVVVLNVLEHLPDESLAIKNCRYLLKPGGTLVVLVPAYMLLYSPLDKQLGHFRRYRLHKLRKTLVENGMNPQKGFYFNSVGIIAWLYAKIFSLGTVPMKEMSVFDRLVPIVKLTDRVLGRKVGLSVICISEK